MKLRTLTLGLLTSLLAIACGHGAAAPKSAASLSGSGKAETASEPAIAATEGSAPADAAPPAPGGEVSGGGAAAPRSQSALSPESPQVARKERPGLGTSWGESRSSQVSSTSFTRDTSQPFAIAALYYNDESGMNAQSRGRFVSWTDSVQSFGDGAIVSITDGNGRPLRAARVDGRVIVVGQDGDRYVIRVENRTPSRLEVVATVDGLDVIDGSDGDFGKRGYVIPSNDTLQIEGFRDSEGTVRTFRFGATDSSYASRVGKGRNVGVIGVALYREMGSDPRWTPEELRQRNGAEPFPNRYAPPPPPPNDAIRAR